MSCQVVRSAEPVLQRSWIAFAGAVTSAMSSRSSADTIRTIDFRVQAAAMTSSSSPCSAGRGTGGASATRIAHSERWRVSRFGGRVGRYSGAPPHGQLRASAR